MATFSFIKTSILIFAYLFLWYQTNYHHQVSALSTLKDDDDASVGNSSSTLSSSEEDIHKTHGRLKTLGSDGPHVRHKGYGDYRPPLKKGGGVTVPPFVGQYPHPTSRYGTPKRDHVNSKYGTPKKDHVTSNFGTLNSGTPKNKSFSQRSKRVKDVLRALWKKCPCSKIKCKGLVLLSLLTFALYSVCLCFADEKAPSLSAVLPTSPSALLAGILPVLITVGLILLCTLLAYVCWRTEGKCTKYKI